MAASLTGHVVVWEPTNRHVGSSLLVKKLEKDVSTSCTWMPPDCDSTILLGVVGFKSGDVCSFSYGCSDISSDASLNVLFRIHAHDFDICSLVPVQFFEDGICYLATSGRDSYVKVWSMTDAKCKYTNRFRFHQKGSGNPQESTVQCKAWISLAATGESSSSPPSTPRLLAFDPKGGFYTINSIEKPKLCESPSSSQHHSSVVFSLLAVPQSPKLFVSFGMDSQIIVWKCEHNDWHTLRPVASHVCMSSKISSISQGFGACSPLAVGLSEGCVLLLRNVAPPAPNSPISMTRLSPLPPSGNAIGITALAWHPDPQFENLLAIGSSKGHVDVVDVTRPQKRGRTFNLLEGCVYRVVWGPRLFNASKEEGEEIVTEDSSRLFVYAICKGSVFLLLSSNKPLVNLGSMFTTLLTHSSDVKLADIAFRQLGEESTYSWLIGLGSVNGAVNLFGLSRRKESIIPLSRVFIHKKCINSMAWSRHPDKYLLAVGSNHPFITIIDATDSAMQESPMETPTQLTNCLATLEGHGNRITGLDWSPHDHDLVLSGSFDCTATVWRVGLGTSAPIASYRNHFSRIFACAWSSNLPDFVFTGEEFGYLVGWHPSAQDAKAPPSSRKHRQPGPLIPTNELDEVQVVFDEKPQEPILTISEKQNRFDASSSKKLSLLPSLFTTPSATSCSIPVLTNAPPIRIQSRFSIVIDFVSFIKGISIPVDRIMPEFDLLHASSCGEGRRRLIQFVENEALRHFSATSSGANRQSRLDAYLSLLLWLGRADVVAESCVETQHMPFWLMWALELMLKGSTSRSNIGCLVEGDSVKTDIEADDFLQHKVLQLRDVCNEYNRAATLLVSAGRTAYAVRLLLSRGRAKEALLLFRLRLSPSANPTLLLDCLHLLAERLSHTGLPNSALAFLAAGQFDRAADSVRSAVSSSDPPLDHIVSLWTSSFILPDDELIDFKLAYYCVIYATNMTIEDERKQFLIQWKAVLREGSISEYLLNCAAFLLLTEWSGVVTLPKQQLAQIARDRQPSLDETFCVTNVVVDFGVACLTDASAPLEKSLETLREYHPTTHTTLLERLTLKKERSSIPFAFTKICTIIQK
ncbi:unnamed protein product [Mesocestoides corti]|uniref:Uncharacterized protein n=1 Tax=Mesocestoides corti TaxID=53468 RepID=A0A3P6HUG8_MESCO|nr:unnamed protein product [Mesocestoides corti]